ncbi:SHD1 domain-containing protein [Stieleria sp. TO1_6]|uniref:SHD1 domain-containing protein n=1 Tax=Stieleria tagensis TaxID=2956795 RepID=UPI00209BB5AE|nr:SHD1 domain-containing protein [Stieleria tagensis]MCO8124831.1 SHD1 domain-containing protein [Stieleria tagensis]
MFLAEFFLRPIGPCLTRCLCLGILVGLGDIASLHGETWSDISGKFNIEAEYVGVEGTAVVLRRSDGVVAKVPIAKLSAESRARAQQLYQAAQNAAPADAQASETTQPIASSLAQPDFAPTPPNVPPMPAFPENASLQQTVTFVTEQALAGHPEVLWYALPQDIRAGFDSAEVRSTLQEASVEQQSLYQPISDGFMKACEILIRKKQFVLNTPALAMAPPQAKQIITQVYDPLTGLAYESFTALSDMKLLTEHSIRDWANYYGPRIGGHLHALAAVAPPGMIQQYTTQIQVQQTDAFHGTLSIPQPDGTTKTIEMEQYRGRWIPQELAKVWEEKGASLAADLKKQMEESRAQMKANGGQTEAATQAFTQMIDANLNPLLNASTQEEFDQALGGVIAMATMFQGGPALPQ